MLGALLAQKGRTGVHSGRIWGAYGAHTLKVNFAVFLYFIYFRKMLISAPDAMVLDITLQHLMTQSDGI